MSRSRVSPPVPRRRRGDEAPPISPEEAVKALERSGYLLEDRLDHVLRGAFYSTTPNAALPDNETGKSRELDLVAESWSLDRPDDPTCGVFLQLIIEGINNPQPVAFITKDRQPELPDLGLHITPPSMGFQPQDERTGRYEAYSVTELFELAKYHHYARGRIATQYCTFRRKDEGRRPNDRRVNDQWMATHERDHHETFLKLCDAVEYYLNEQRRGGRGGQVIRYRPIRLLYPILVLQGELFQVSQSGTAVTVEPAKHIRYRHALTREQKQVDYRIDVVTEAFFPELLKLIEQSRNQLLRRFAKRLAVEAKKLPTASR